MRIWTEGGFFQNVKGHVLKWWQFVIRSVLRINNNQPNGREGQNMVIPNQQQVGPQHPESALKDQMETDDRSELARQRAAQVRQEKDDQIRSMFLKMGGEDSKSSGGTAHQDSQDPMEVLRRIKQEKEGLNSKEVEEARKQAQEQERIASIMNANKVNLKAFIEAGKASREAARASENKQGAMSEEDIQKQEEMRRAQEIIDRLNREAAEDEAKKKAQIEEAKRNVKETFIE